MEASPFSSSLIARPHFSGRFPRRRIQFHRRDRPLSTKIRATGNCESSDDRWESEGKTVDESMMSLRNRIREVKALDRAVDRPPAEDWSEWEKEYYCTFYESDVLEVLGQLQLYAMNTRPTLTIGITVMVSLSLPVSVLVVMMHLVDAAKGILDVVQLKG